MNRLSRSALAAAGSAVFTFGALAPPSEQNATSNPQPTVEQSGCFEVGTIDPQSDRITNLGAFLLGYMNDRCASEPGSVTLTRDADTVTFKTVETPKHPIAAFQVGTLNESEIVVEAGVTDATTLDPAKIIGFGVAVRDAVADDLFTARQVDGEWQTVQAAANLPMPTPDELAQRAVQIQQTSN